MLDKYTGKFSNGVVNLVITSKLTGSYVTHFTIRKNDGCQYQSSPKDAHLTGSNVSINWAEFSWKAKSGGQVSGIIGMPGSYIKSNVQWENLRAGKCHFSHSIAVKIRQVE